MLTISFCLVLGLVMLDDQQRQTAEKRIREALRLADISITKAALWMNLERSDLDKALQGLLKLDVWRLEMLPDVFHQHYHLLCLRDRGLPEYAKTSLKIAPAVEEMKKESA